jgi:hypothetical protein
MLRQLTYKYNLPFFRQTQGYKVKTHHLLISIQNTSPLQKIIQEPENPLRQCRQHLVVTLRWPYKPTRVS